MTREVKHKHEQVPKYLQSIREKRENQYTGCAIWALLTTAKDPRICALQVIFCDESLFSQWQEDSREYASYKFLLKKISVAEGFALSEKLVHGGKVKIGSDIIEVAPCNLEIEQWGGLESPIQIRWPVVLIQFNLERSCESYQEKPLIALNQPAFPRVSDAKKDWFPVPFTPRPSIGLRRDLGIIIPDYRARFKQVTLDQRSVEIDISSGQLPMKYLIAKYHLEVEGKPNYGDIKLKDGKAVLNVRNYPNQVNIYLIERNSGDLIDYLDYYSSWMQKPLGVVVKVPGQQLRFLIDGGENESVEFKQDFNPKNRKEFLESVIAFANGEGGRILVGVTDSCQIFGVYDSELKLRIQNSVFEKCEPKPKLSFEHVSLEGKEVLVMAVEPGNNKPYMIDGTVYVRAGGSDRPAKRSEVDHMYQEKTSGVFSRF